MRISFSGRGYLKEHTQVSYITPAEDRDVTQRLKEAGRLLGISVLEHIIITEYGYATL